MSRSRFRHPPCWRRAPGLALAGVFAACALVASTDAHAGEAPDASVQPARARYVSVRVAAQGEESLALLATLRELVSRLGLALRETSGDAPASAFMAAPQVDGDERARVSVDETATDHVVVLVEALESGKPSSPVERSVPRGASSAILTEQVAHVIHSTLESLLAGDAPPAAPRPTAPAAASEKPADQPLHRESFGLVATAFAAGRGVASNTGPSLGGGASVGVTAGTSPWKPSVSLGGAYYAPFGASATDVSLQTTIASFRAVASVRIPRTKFVGVDAGLGAGADLFHTVPGNPGSSLVTLGATQDLVDPVVTARIVAGFRVLAGARVTVGVDVDFDAGGHRYGTETDATRAFSAVLQPWPVRPSAMVGLCLPLIGSIGCAGSE
jgi:hypothetical protein